MGSIYRRGSVYWVQYYRAGKAFRESTGSTRITDARQLLKMREGDAVRGMPIVPKVSKTTFDELAADVVADYRINKKRSLDKVIQRVEKHLRPFFGGRLASTIGAADVRQYVVQRQKEGAANATVNRELAVLKRGFSLGAQAKKVMAKPHIPMLAENNVRQGFFEQEQFDAVCANLPEHLRALATFCYITGWRISEVVSLQWRQVDMRAGLVTLEVGTTKSGAGRRFPFTDNLRALLMDQRAVTQTLERERGIIVPSVFHHRGGQPIKKFRRAWLTACRKAGYPGLLVHDFRRTAVRNLVRAGVPQSVAMAMVGHKTAHVFRRYDIVSEQDLRDAAERLNTAHHKHSVPARVSTLQTQPSVK